MLENITQELFYIESTEDIPILISDSSTNIGTVSYLSEEDYMIAVPYTNIVNIGDYITFSGLDISPRKVVSLNQVGVVTTEITVNKRIVENVIGATTILNENFNDSTNGMIDKSLAGKIVDYNKNKHVYGQNIVLEECSKLDSVESLYLYDNNTDAYVTGLYYKNNLKNTTNVFEYNKLNQEKYIRSFDLGDSIGGNSEEIFISPNGRKMYAINGTTIYQFELITPRDVTTAVLSDDSFDLSSETTIPTAMFIDYSGTKMYIVSSSDSTIYEYTLGVEWKISSAVYTTNSFNTNGEDSYPRDVYFNKELDKMYVAGYINDNVYQYNLSIAGNIATSVYSGFNLDTSAGGFSSYGLSFSDDMAILYVADDNKNCIFQYTISDINDISSGRLLTNCFYIGEQETSIKSFFIKENDLYILGDVEDKIFQYVVKDPEDIGTTGVDIKFKLNLTKELIKGSFGSNTFTGTSIGTVLKVILNGSELSQVDYTVVGDVITIINEDVLNDFNYLTVYHYPDQSILNNVNIKLHYKGYANEVGFLYDWYRENLTKIKLIDTATTGAIPSYYSYKKYLSRNKTNITIDKNASRLNFTAKLDTDVDDYSEVKTNLRTYIPNPDNFRVFKVEDNGSYVKCWSGCYFEDGISTTDQKSPANEISYSISFLDYEVWRYVGTGYPDNVNGYIKEVAE